MGMFDGYAGGMFPDPMKIGPGPEGPLETALRNAIFNIAPGTLMLDVIQGYNAARAGDWPKAAAFGSSAAVEALPFAIGLPGSPIGAAADGAAMLASRSPMLYNPAAKAPRPFAADYPSEAPTDGAGNLTADIDGRPLVARYVAGRRVVGGDDQTISPAQSQSVGEGSVGAVYQTYPAAEMPRGASGFYRQGRDTQGVNDYSIGIRRDLTPTQAGRVVQHETGHLIDESAGQIPTSGIVTDLQRLYNALNTGQERTRNLTLPQHFGYQPEAVPREMMAEAIRAYMADPNYIKTVAPNVARRIRQYVNTNPALAPYIQFNSIAVPAAGGLGAIPFSLAPQQ